MPAPFVAKHENVLVALLAIFTVIRLFAFSSALPFFCNTDEQMHYDMVVKYSHGFLPRDNYPSQHFETESAITIGRTSSSEYLDRYDLPPGYKIPPMAANQMTGLFMKIRNHEFSSPPLYYAVAGAWYDLGKLLGIRDFYLLYWIRYLNIPLYGLLFWAAYRFCRLVGPDNASLRLGVLMLLAFMPQSVFYTINSDILSPLLSVLSLALLLRLYMGENRPWLYCAAGLSVAGTILIKLSNLPILVAFGILFAALLVKHLRAGDFLIQVPRLGILLVSALAPLALWGWLNRVDLGDFTGTAAKVTILGWRVQPIYQIFNHPIFTLDGFWYFTSKLVASFWRGELVWHAERITTGSADIFYLSTTLVFGLVGVWTLFRKHDGPCRRMCGSLIACIPLLYVLFLGYLSTRYDFGRCRYPSRALPFFISGRLMLGGLVPLLVIYVKGVEASTAALVRKLNPLAVVAAVVFLCVFFELTTTVEMGIFSSPLNFFHI